MKIAKRSEKGERKRGEQESSRGHKFSILENSCPFGTASCWGVPAPNPAGTSTANWKLFYLRSINPMIEKINPTIPIPITSSPIPDEQRESIMAKSSIAIPNPIFFIVNPPLQIPIYWAKPSIPHSTMKEHPRYSEILPFSCVRAYTLRRDSKGLDPLAHRLWHKV